MILLERNGIECPEAKRYTPEFKEQAAKRVVNNKLPIAQAARELAVVDLQSQRAIGDSDCRYNRSGVR